MVLHNTNGLIQCGSGWRSIIPSIHINQANKFANLRLIALLMHFFGRLNYEPDVCVKIITNLYDLRIFWMQIVEVLVTTPISLVQLAVYEKNIYIVRFSNESVYYH